MHSLIRPKNVLNIASSGNVIRRYTVVYLLKICLRKVDISVRPHFFNRYSFNSDLLGREIKEWEIQLYPKLFNNRDWIWKFPEIARRFRDHQNTMAVLIKRSMDLIVGLESRERELWLKICSSSVKKIILIPWIIFIHDWIEFIDYRICPLGLGFWLIQLNKEYIIVFWSMPMNKTSFAILIRIKFL